jgi:hypothetical protein
MKETKTTCDHCKEEIIDVNSAVVTQKESHHASRRFSAKQEYDLCWECYLLLLQFLNPGEEAIEQKKSKSVVWR